MEDDIIKKIAKHFSACKITVQSKGTILTHAGEEPTGITFLSEGIVEQYDITPAGNKVTVMIYKPNSFFPLSWAINGTPNRYFFEALTSIQTQTADPTETVTFLKKNPDVTFDLLSRVYRGADALLKQLVLARSGSSNRLLYEILLEAYRFGNEIEQGIKIINIKQHTLAARSGLARETVSRELHKLDQDGILKLTPHGTVVNLLQLEQVLELNK